MGKALKRKLARKEIEKDAGAAVTRLVYFMNGLLDCERVAKKLAKAEMQGTEQEKVAKQEILKRLGLIKSMLEEAWNGQPNS